MKHQYYEEWLLMDEPLPAEQKQLLQEHLKSCDSCLLLSQKLGEVSNNIRRSPMIAPEPGFTNRWLARFHADQERLQRRQALGMLVFFISAAVLLFASLLLLSLPAFGSFEVLLLALIYQAIGLYSQAAETQSLLVQLLVAAFTHIPLIVWILIAGLASELVVLWVVSYRVLTNPRRVSR